MKKGSHQTEEEKKRISEKISKIRKEYNPMTGRTGELHPNFGKHWSEEVRKKMSASHKGKPSTFKGKYHTEEAKRKNSEAHKGNKNGMFGKVYTEKEKLEKSAIAKKNFKNNSMYREVEFKAPCGTTFIVNNQSVFSKKLNIHPSALTDIIKGRTKTAKGWSKG